MTKAMRVNFSLPTTCVLNTHAHLTSLVGSALLESKLLRPSSSAAGKPACDRHIICGYDAACCYCIYSVCGVMEKQNKTSIIV